MKLNYIDEFLGGKHEAFPMTQKRYLLLVKITKWKIQNPVKNTKNVKQRNRAKLRYIKLFKNDNRCESGSCINREFING